MFKLLTTLLLLNSVVQAQLQLGLETGISSNKLQTNISSGQNTSMKSRPGLLAGIVFKIPVSRSFLLELTPSFFQKNYIQERTGQYRGIRELNTNSYIQVPIEINYKIVRGKIVYYAGMGLFYSYWMSGQIKGKIPDIFNVVDSVGPGNQLIEYFGLTDYKSKYKFDRKRDNRHEIGWSLDAGISYLFKELYSISFKLRFVQSITDQQKKYMIHQQSRYNQTFAFAVNLTKTLSKKTR